MHQAVQRASLRNGYVMGPSKLAGLGASGFTIGQGTSSIGAAALAVAPAFGPAAPFVAAAGVLVGMAGRIMDAVGLGTGCGPTCVAASNFANQVEPLMEKNIKAYFAIPAPRSISNQAIGLYAFDQAWEALRQSCGNPQLQVAGQNCIQDRQQGACHWHQTGNPEFPGQPATGECWNWFRAYRDPIAMDAAVPDDQSSTPPALTGTGTGSSSVASVLAGVDMSNLVLIGGAALLLFGIAGSK